MKILFSIISCVLVLHASCQDMKPKFDGKNWNAPYFLPTPEGWDIERFTIPIEFAPAIPYKGVEDIRFTPGWGKIETTEYWSYAFLWYLDSTVKFNSKIIKRNLGVYYTGLININTDKTKITADKLVPVKVYVKKKHAEGGDLKTFEGTVHMSDFMTLKPISLNLLIHIKSCKGQNKTFVFYEVSPKPFTDKVWEGMHRLWANFKCSKTD